MSGFSSLARWPTCQPSSFPNKFISVTSARYLVWLPCRRLTASSPLTATSASKPPSDNASATMSRISCSSSTTRIVTPAPCMLSPCAPRCAIGEGTRDKELCSILNTASKGPPPNECQLDFRSAGSCATSPSIREGRRHARGGCAAGLVALAGFHFWLGRRLIAPDITPAARPQAAWIEIDLFTLSGLRRFFWRAWWRQSVFQGALCRQLSVSRRLVQQLSFEGRILLARGQFLQTDGALQVFGQQFHRRPRLFSDP